MADAVRLILPNHIQGEWSAAVLLTYTANLSFFESQLLPQLRGRGLFRCACRG